MTKKNVLTTISVVLATISLIGCGRGFEAVKVRGTRTTSTPQSSQPSQSQRPQAQTPVEGQPAGAPTTPKADQNQTIVEGQEGAAARTEVQPPVAGDGNVTGSEQRSANPSIEIDPIADTFRAFLVLTENLTNGRLLAKAIVKVDRTYYAVTFERKMADLVKGKSIDLLPVPGSIQKVANGTIETVTALAERLNVSSRVKVSVNCNEKCEEVRATIAVENEGQAPLVANAHMKALPGQPIGKMYEIVQGSGTTPSIKTEAEAVQELVKASQAIQAVQQVLPRLLMGQ